TCALPILVGWFIGRVPEDRLDAGNAFIATHPRCSHKRRIQAPHTDRAHAEQSDSRRHQCCRRIDERQSERPSCSPNSRDEAQAEDEEVGVGVNMAENAQPGETPLAERLVEIFGVMAGWLVRWLSHRGWSPVCSSSGLVFAFPVEAGP